MKIGIVGMGTVGRTLWEGFLQKGHDVYANDVRDLGPTLTQNTPKETLMAECQVVFICVDTPSRQDNGGCDLTNVYTVFNELHRAWGELSRKGEGIRVTEKQPIIAIKSTVIPGTLDTLKKAYPWCCSNPEFMRQDSALEDFLNPDRIVVGADKEVVLDIMHDLYEDFGAPIIEVTPREAEAIKYFSNAFLVLKVAFSQEVWNICAKMDVNSRNVMNGVTGDHRINPSHLDPIRGPIEYNSPCLVKDLRAIIQATEMSSYDPWLLKAAYITGVKAAGFNLKMEVHG